MSDTQTVWRRLQIEGSRQGEHGAALSITLQANGKTFVATVSGDNPLTVMDVINAFRAATAHAVQHFGGNPESVGGVTTAADSELLNAPAANGD